VDAFATSLRSIAIDLDSQPRDALSGAQLHLRASIYHHLEELDAALRYYDAAIEKYAAEGEPAMRALCLLDSGDLLHEFRQPALAHIRFRQAWKELRNTLTPEERLPLLFELYAKAMEADSHRRIGNLGEAELLLGEVMHLATQLPETHPLRAFALERRGWLQLDNWKLDEAEADFRAALDIRRSHDPENHRARHFIYWNMQGVGMAQMYQGEADAARQLFRALLEQIDRPPREITSKQRRELLDRRPNLHERLADTSLFLGNDGPDDHGNDPVRELEEAIATAQDQRFLTDGRKAILIRLQYKAAVVRALRGDVEQATRHVDAARAIELAASAKPSTTTSAAPQGRRRPNFEMTKQAAMAALLWKSNNGAPRESGRNELMQMIAAADAGLPRDDLLLLLYVGEQLVESDELAPRDRVALARQMQKLIRVQSFPAQDPKAGGSPARVPGVFQRYLTVAEQAGAKE
jgi:tetratricopeptide (TPR) repeat protein